MSARYALFGNPVGHSKSPAIHAEFARRTGQDLVYEAICPPVDGFAAALAAFHAAGGRGGNVTVPFKEEAAGLCTSLSERAALAGAVNTLSRDGEGWRGDNTDGAGLVRDLARQGIRLAGARVLLLGAGGAARGILGPLLAAGPAELVIANRTPDKAEALARRFAASGPVRAQAYAALSGRFELVLNATAAGLAGTLPPLPDGLFAEDAAAYDLVYGPAARPFLDWAQAQGAARCRDGLGMLVEQAAEAFFLWRGLRPDTAGLADALRRS